MEIIHSDIWGPAQTPTINGKRYYITFIDDYTRFIWVYFLKEKSEALNRFMDFKTYVEKQYGQWIKCLRTDGGGEYVSHAFEDYLRKHGIRRQLTCRYTPQQNGVAERKNRVICEVARAMLNEKNMPNHFWAEACATAVYVLNKTPT
ncbi:transposase family protein, partial [Escherichia coli]|nr:transposase family protein [Escherichia coli]